MLMLKFSEQYISKSREPKPPSPPRIGGPKYQSSLPRDKWARRASASGEHERPENPTDIPHSEKPPYFAARKDGQSRFQEEESLEPNAGVLDAFPIPNRDPHLVEEARYQDDGLPARKPLSEPVLTPIKRYCHRDEIVKPMRAHHCRACGTVS